MKKITLLLFTIFAFTIGNAQVGGTSSPGVAIPDADPTGASDAIVVANASGTVTDVVVDVNINHTWMGDVSIILTAPDGTTTADLLVHAGTPDGTGFGCSQNNILATFSDAGVATAELVCDTSAWDEGIDPPGGETYAISGTHQAGAEDGTQVSLAAAFAGVTDANGSWTLTVADKAGGDTGTLISWTVTITGPVLGLDDNTIQGFKFSPNPVVNNLKLDAAQNITNVEVYNLLGQQVMRVMPNTISSNLNMSSLNAGAYFVKVSVGDVTETVRIIKQ